MLSYVKKKLGFQGPDSSPEKPNQPGPSPRNSRSSVTKVKSPSNSQDVLSKSKSASKSVPQPPSPRKSVSSSSIDEPDLQFEDNDTDEERRMKVEMLRQSYMQQIREREQEMDSEIQFLKNQQKMEQETYDKVFKQMFSMVEIAKEMQKGVRPTGSAVRAKSSSWNLVWMQNLESIPNPSSMTLAQTRELLEALTASHEIIHQAVSAEGADALEIPKVTSEDKQVAFTIDRAVSLNGVDRNLIKEKFIAKENFDSRMMSIQRLRSSWKEQQKKYFALQNEGVALQKRMADLSSRNDELSRLESLSVQSKILNLVWPMNKLILDVRRLQTTVYAELFDLFVVFSEFIAFVRHLFAHGVTRSSEFAVQETLDRLQKLEEQIPILEQKKREFVRAQKKMVQEGFANYDKMEDVLRKSRAAFELEWKKFQEKQIKAASSKRQGEWLDISQWPMPLDIEYSFKFGALMPSELIMGPVDPSAGSRCQSDVPAPGAGAADAKQQEEEEGEQQEESLEALRAKVANAPAPALKLKPNQLIPARVLDPRLRAKGYRGLNGDQSVGSGKTLMGLEVVRAWWEHAGEETNTHREALVLLPTSRLFGTWKTELLKSSLGKEVVREVLHGSASKPAHCAEIVLTNDFRIVLQDMRYALADSVHNRYMELDGAEEANISYAAAQFRKTLSYSGNPIYASLSASEIKALDAQIAKTASKIEYYQTNSRNPRNVSLPPRGLVIIDEADRLVNPKNYLAAAQYSNCVLAYAATLMFSDASRLLATGTPSVGMDFFRQIQMSCSPEGWSARKLPRPVWRIVLSKKALRDEKRTGGLGDSDLSLDQRAVEAEKEYFNKNFVSEKGVWVEGAREQLQSQITGLWSWFSLERDVTVYPQLDISCEATGTCRVLVRGVGQEGEFQMASVDSQYRSAEPAPKGKVSGLPSGEAMIDENVKAKSLNGALEVLVPLHPQVFKNYNENLRKNKIDLSDEKARLENLKWGVKSTGPINDPIYAEKFKFIRRYMLENKGKKIFAFSGMRTFAEFGKPLTGYFSKKDPSIGDDNAYNILDLPSAYQIMISSINEIIKNEMDSMPESKNWSASRKEEYRAERITELRASSMFIRTITENWYRAREEEIKNGKWKPWIIYFGKSINEADYTKFQTLMKNAGLDIDSLSQLILDINNDRRNVNGEMIQLFVGDQEANVGLSLLDTYYVFLMEPSVSREAMIQAVARALRYCSLSRNPNVREWLVKVFVLISTIPGGKESSSSESGYMHLTAEEIQIAALKSEGDADKELMKAARETAVDCFLLRGYNSAGLTEPVECYAGAQSTFGKGLDVDLPIGAGKKQLIRKNRIFQTRTEFWFEFRGQDEWIVAPRQKPLDARTPDELAVRNFSELNFSAKEIPFGPYSFLSEAILAWFDRFNSDPEFRARFPALPDSMPTDHLSLVLLLTLDPNDPEAAYRTLGLSLPANFSLESFCMRHFLSLTSEEWEFLAETVNTRVRPQARAAWKLSSAEVAQIDRFLASEAKNLVSLMLKRRDLVDAGKQLKQQFAVSK